ncbi:MAG: beta galactosidase jelly roll domain-containing protein [Williamsia sp.]|nr:beta galactosidase jelly roll domain-containing protein [Williamsia sp.]
MKKCFLLIFLLATTGCCMATIRVSKIFGDSMVLQRDRPIPVWGWADPNEKVTVQFHGQTKTVSADAGGKWKLLLNQEGAGGPYTLTVSGPSNKISFSNILLGDIWVCSGQSNMEFALRGVTNAAAEIQAADFPQIRHFYLPKDISATPLDDLTYPGSWKPATPANAKDFTAVGYFFARELYQQLHIPVGLIHTSWGGTNIETWISREGLAGSSLFKDFMTTLPRLNLDSLTNSRTEKVNQLVKQVQGSLPAANAARAWKDPAYDDHAWPQMQAPGLWEQQLLKDFDGVVWLRKTIAVSAANAGRPAELHLSTIDDSDDSYVNGQKAGSTKNEYSTKRVYRLPAGLLREGKNVIAVRVEDTGGGGGIYGDAKDLYITIGNTTISLAGSWSFQVESVSRSAATIGPNSYPSLLYNAMINPIIPFAIKGAIWYQGESNASRAYQYRQAFPLLINDWRRLWHEENFPFYFVQLASFKASGGTSAGGSTWAELREAQTMTLSLPNTGMAVTTDIGETNDIHPKNKQDVGKRLAAVALHDTYHKTLVYTGPVYKSMITAGNKALIEFTQTGSGLVTKQSSPDVKGFEIAGTDQQFHPAHARIEGNKVSVYADEVATPAAVRYAWADDAGQANLFNKEGFPAAPFRTDKWKGITEGQKYNIP